MSSAQTAPAASFERAALLQSFHAARRRKTILLTACRAAVRWPWNSPPFSDYPFDDNGHTGLIKPDLCAPGPGSRSCNFLFNCSNGETPYRDFGFTSAAAAHLGGCLALLAQACKRSKKPIVAANILEALEKGAVWITGQTKKKENNFGAGPINVYAAYQYGRTRRGNGGTSNW